MISSDTKMLLANAHSDDPLKQVHALAELINLHDESVAPEILDLVSSADEDVRAESARALGFLGDGYREKIGPVLLKLVEDENQRVRNEAVEALGLQPYPPAREVLTKVLRSDPSWIVRASAAEALANYQDESLVANLEQVLRDNHEESIVKAYAAFAIGLLASPSFRPELDNYIATATTPDLLSDILAASYRLGEQKYLPSLLNLLKTADEDDIWGILNSIQDLTERRYPPTLLADASQIREALTALEQRNSLYRNHIAQILNNLAQLEQAV
jgi:HEAT repeat protein